MIRGGNNFYTLFQKLYFFCLPTCRLRSKYIQKHSYQFRHIGNAIKWQPRKYPADPEYISIGNNVKLSANVSFITHDICHEMFNHAGYGNFKPYVGCIEIGNNVMIGANVTIMPNVKIGDNVIIAAGSIITKDCQNDTIWGGDTRKTYRLY